MALLPDRWRRDPLSGQSSKAPGLVRRTLGRTGVAIPIVGLGGPGKPDLIDAALDRGLVHINTSPDYENGNQEIMIGATLKGRRRESVLLATAFSMWKRPKDQARTYSPQNIIDSLNASLSRLKMNHVDIFYIAGAAGRTTVLHEPFLETMTALKKSGKTRWIGVTAHQSEAEVLRASVDARIYDVVLTAYNFRKLYKDEIKAAIRTAAVAGVGIIAMKTQAGVYWDQDRKEMIDMKAALKWVLQDENVHSAVPAFSSLEQLSEGVSVMTDLKLTPAEKAALRLGDDPLPSGLFCQACQDCLSQCGGDIDIPTFMRSYMYKHGYDRPRQALEHVQHVDFSRVPCLDCSSCRVRCRIGADVKARILDVMATQP